MSYAERAAAKVEEREQIIQNQQMKDALDIIDAATNKGLRGVNLGFRITDDVKQILESKEYGFKIKRFNGRYNELDTRVEW